MLENYGLIIAMEEKASLLNTIRIGLPTPTDIHPRVLSTAIDLIDGTASLKLAIETAHYYDIKDHQAQEITREVRASVSSWREEATKLRINKSEIERMASAFEHDDLSGTI